MSTDASLSASKTSPLASQTKSNSPHDQPPRGGIGTDRNINQAQSSPLGEDDHYGHLAPDTSDGDVIGNGDAEIDVAELEQLVGLTDAEAEVDAMGVAPLGSWREEMGWWGEWWAFTGFARWMD
ncbi:MAG: hypothetical protein Q9184_004702 [Pyrenodesmia sp. 2 TL-2023]